jgi:hypothetical protein
MIMRKIHLVAMLLPALFIQPVFADDTTTSNSKPCATIAKACLKAGYTRNNQKTHQFWTNCMKPTILGQSVKGLTIDSTTIKSCRDDKIAELKTELKEFESVSSN